MMKNVEYCFEYMNPYNLIAQLISRLRYLDPKAFQDRVYRDSLVWPDDVATVVNNFFDMHSFLADGKELARCGVPAEVFIDLQRWEHFDEFIYLFELLLRLCRKLTIDDVLKSPYVKRLQRSGFKSLNDNWEETGFYVLPRLRTINDSLEPAREGEPPVTKKWADEDLPGVNADLANFFVVEDAELTVNGIHFDMRHYILDRIPRWVSQGDLVIAFSPIVFADVLNIETYVREINGKKQRYFAINGLKKETLIKKQIESAFLRACQERVDILLFPEMLGNESILDTKFFQSLCDRAQELGYCTPMLVLMPTWWHNRQNELQVRTGAGRTICMQMKFTPFPYKAEDGEIYIEDLDTDRPCVQVLHIPELGRITFPICRDLFSEDYLRIMVKQVKATLLFCPSFSPGTTRFDFESTEPIRYGCYTVWGNTCSAAFEKGKHPPHIGLVSGPQSDGKAAVFLEPKCHNSCAGGDTACLFVIKISMDRAAVISYDHFCSTIPLEEQVG